VHDAKAIFCNALPVQRDEIINILVQEAENLKLMLKQDPSSYDRWFAMGEIALEVALAATGEQARRYLMEVRLTSSLHPICCFPTLL
jgi:hypothetical protein